MAEPTTSGAEAVVELRPRLLGLAYRLLGSWAEAEDVVGDVAERWTAQRPADLVDPEGWLVTVTTRRALDVLRSSRVRRTDYPGEWLPEPIATGPDAAVDLEHLESLTIGFLRLLERLTPLERVVLVLRDALDYPYELIAEAVGRSQDACRQALHRARRHVTVPTRRTEVDRDHAAAVARRFVEVSLGGDLDALLRSLAPDVVVVSDGGGVVRAALHAIVGPDRAARFLANLARRSAAGAEVHPCELNGEDGFLVRGPDRTLAVVLHVEGATVAAVYLIANPDKLGVLATVPGPAGSEAPGPPGPGLSG